MKYTLGDLTVKRWNDWDRVPRDPVTVGAMILSGGTVAAAGTALYVGQFVVGYLVTTAITSWAMNALAPKPDLGSLSSSGILVNAKDATAPAEFVYGEVRKGGVVTFYESTGNTNKYLHQIIVLAAHEVNSIGDIYINDVVVTLNGSGFVTSDGWDSKIRIKKLDGSQTAADSDLLSETSVTSNFIGSGLPYLYVRYEYDQDVFANGIPLITAVVQGKKVYDPRTASTAYSNNAALCIRDFLTASYGLNDSAIDETAFAAAANECDETVALDAGGTEKRYTINGIVRADRSVGDVLGDMMAACAGTLFWGSGYWKLKAGAYSSPVKTLTLDDLRSSISLDTRITLRDNFNEVQGTFNDAAQDWITVDYPKLTSAAFLAEDGGSGNETALDLQLPYTTSASAAQRLAKLTLFRGREQMTVTAEFGMNAFDIEVGDIIAFTNDRYGWDEKEFEVIGWRLAANQDAGDLRVALTLRETSAAAFNWNAEESAIIGNNTTLPVYTAGLNILGLSVGDGGNTQGDGTFIESALVSWTAVTNAYIDRYEVQWRRTSDSTYASTFTTDNSIELTPIVDGVEYTVRVRAITANGYRGPFASATFTGGGDTTAPAVPTSISANGGYKYITISWTNPADADLNYVEIYENDTNQTSGATMVGKSSGDSFVRTNLGVDVTKYYFLKSVDYSGNVSGFSSGVSATTEFLEDDFEDGIRQLFIDQNLDVIASVSSLPPAGDFAGQQVFLTTDGKLYNWNGSAWTLTIGATEAGDLIGQIAGTQITDGAISAPKIAANTITGDKIVANTITGGLLATSGIITDSAQINDALITNAKIDNAAITTAKIGNLQVDTAKIANGAVTNRFAAFTASNLTPTTSYQLLQELTIDCDGNPISVLFNAGVNGATSVDIDVRLDGVSQRTFRTSSGYYTDATGWNITIVTAFIGSVPDAHNHVAYIYSTVQYFELMSTVAMTMTPSSGSRLISVYGRLNGGNSSSPVIRNRYLETTELKK